MGISLLHSCSRTRVKLNRVSFPRCLSQARSLELQPSARQRARALLAAHGAPTHPPRGVVADRSRATSGGFEHLLAQAAGGGAGAGTALRLLEVRFTCHAVEPSFLNLLRPAGFR